MPKEVAGLEVHGRDESHQEGIIEYLNRIKFAVYSEPEGRRWAKNSASLGMGQEKRPS
jgi:hypothetical protein